MSVRKARRRLSPAVRREEILAAAESAFLEGGYHGTHISDIVERAQVARGTFYLYFDSKQAVFEALVDRMLAIFLSARPAEPELEIVDLASAATVLRNSYRAVLSAFRENRGLCRLMFDEAVGVEQGLAAKLEAHTQVWVHRVEQTLRVLVNRGVARANLDVEATAVMVIGSVTSVTRRYLLAGAEPDLERLIDALVSYELSGIEG